MVTHTFYVNNIKCDGCVNSIRNGIMKIKGVTGVDVFKEESAVNVMGVAIERGDIRGALNSLGYPEKGSNNILHRAKSFISCAIGNVHEKQGSSL